MDRVDSPRIVSSSTSRQPPVTSEHTPTQLRYQTFPPTRRSREVMQEAVVNEMMGFGRQSRATSSIPAPNTEHYYELDASDPFSTPLRITTLHPAEMQRPLTPHPATSFEDFCRSSRLYRYASAPLPFSAQRPTMQETPNKSAPSSPVIQPPRCVNTVRRPTAPPRRRPADYRAERAFSFALPISSTPFWTPDAPMMTPDHPHYTAKRVGGVELEYRALEKAEGATTGMHRALWPEERLTLQGEIDSMKRRLVSNLGVVRNYEVEVAEVKENEEVEGKKETEKKEKIGWLRRWWRKKKNAASVAVDVSSATVDPPRAKVAKREATAIIIAPSSQPGRVRKQLQKR